MSLVSLRQLLGDAHRDGYAVGYFEAWDGYSLEAVVEAAEAERAPVVIGFGCLLVDQRWLDDGGIELLGYLSRRAAERSRVPVALLLNEAHTLDQALAGLDAGFNSVMMHTSDWPADRAIAAVSELVEIAHRRGASVEAELGHLPDGSTGVVDVAGAALTDPEEAGAFVAATGVDCLAVSVGNVHLLQAGEATVDLERLAAVHERVPVPLAIHGGTSFPRAAVPEAIARGVAKLNVGTVLKSSFLAGVRDAAAVPDASPHDLLGSHGSRDLLGTGKARMGEVVRDLIRLYGGSGRAA